VALNKRLVGVGWGDSFKALRTSCLALAFAPAEYCAPVWWRSAHTKTHRCTFKRVDARYHWLLIRSTPSSFLPILSGITPPETMRSAYAWYFTPKPSIRNIFYTKLCLKPSPKRLRSRKPLCSFVELLSINGEPTTLFPAALQSFIPAFGQQPPGCDLPRNAWVQLKRLRTGFGRFAANMILMGLCGSDLCECGKVQTAHHILHDCTKFKPPCHINEVDNPAILEYLTQSKFWPTCIPVHVYERRISHYQGGLTLHPSKGRRMNTVHCFYLQRLEIRTQTSLLP